MVLSLKVKKKIKMVNNNDRELKYFCLCCKSTIHSFTKMKITKKSRSRCVYKNRKLDN